jgi:hypothetical protein
MMHKKGTTGWGNCNIIEMAGLLKKLAVLAHLVCRRQQCEVPSFILFVTPFDLLYDVLV